MNEQHSSEPSQSASATIIADQHVGPQISRGLFGKFTEHLGRNVYGGAWAETIENPWFASIETWPNPDHIRQQLISLADEHDMADKDSVPHPGLAPFWMPKGDIRATLDRGIRGPAQQITTMAAGAGLRTLVYLPLHRQRGYRLTIRGRASKTTRIVARLLTLRGDELSWGDTSLGTGGWHTVQRTLRRAPGRDLPTSTPVILELQLEHPVTVWLDRCSLIPADDRYGWDPEVITWMTDVQLPLLRFPGGNFVSGYHWRDGVGPVDQRPILPNPAWPIIEWNDVGTDEWLQLCNLVECEPLICVNAGSGTPQEAADWVAYCNSGIETPMGALRSANGRVQPYNVKRWEIGNELYGDWQIGHVTADSYAQRYMAFRAAMLAVDPDLQIIANGHDAEWNQALVDRAGSAISSISVHTLEGNHIPAEADPEAVYREFIGYASVYGDHLESLAEPMRQAGIEAKLAITELSVFTLKSGLPNVDNLSEALYYSGIVNASIRSGGLVELITHSALINHSAGLVKQRGIVYPHPVWRALRLYSTHEGIQPVQVTVQCSSFSCTGEWLTKVKQIDTIDAVALISQDAKTLVVFLTNRSLESDVDFELAIDGFDAGADGSLSFLTGETFMASNSWQNPDFVRIKAHMVSLENGHLNHVLPRHSLTRLVLSNEE
ncbi:MAG: hypothetical protein HOH43_18465 [Candidatus Latescibacteria bacterium]|nr:hypothetical protein [Candidatus Latescibacterota bacterium]